MNDWLTENEPQTDASLTIKQRYMNESDQIILDFINPELPHFPRGFTQSVALSHDGLDLNKLDKSNIKLENNKPVEFYLSTYRYLCKFINVKSSREAFF